MRATSRQPSSRNAAQSGIDHGLIRRFRQGRGHLVEDLVLVVAFDFQAVDEVFLRLAGRYPHHADDLRPVVADQAHRHLDRPG